MAKSATIDVVLTTVGTGEVLEHYRALLADGSLSERVRLVVVPDRRTPWDLFRRASELQDEGVDVVCPTVREQEELLERWGARSFVPTDSDNRLNVGFAIAWRDGRDVVVTVDDDNYPLDASFFSTHAVVAAPSTSGDVLASSTGWFNRLDLLTYEPVAVWPRGFPFRHRRTATTTVARGEAEVAINAGLWLGEPDVDALTRITVAPRCTVPSRGAVILDPGTWCTINMDNTAVRREVLPAWWSVRMGHQAGEVTFDRYGDVLGVLFAEACAKHLGHAVRVGDPYARRMRATYVTLADVAAEVPAAVLLEDVADWLTSARLEGDDYASTYVALSHLLEDAVEHLRGTPWTDTARAFFHRVAHGMRTWVRLLERAAG